MLAAFCMRLALGMVAFLPLLPADKMHPRFFRTQYLTAFALAIVGAVFGWREIVPQHYGALIGSVILTLVGALIWTLDPPPLSRWIWLLTTPWLIYSVLQLTRYDVDYATNMIFSGADALVSGLFLGAAITAMLVGHSYLISPGLSITPLMTMLWALATTWLIRTLILAISWYWVDVCEFAPLVWSQQWFFMLPRWLIGLVGTLILGIMAFLTARMRSTQSATGILFVVVICTFIGELLGLLIARETGFAL